MTTRRAFGASLAVLGLAATLALASCAGSPEAIPTGLDARSLVQRAQEASDASKYELALRYYQALIDDWGSEPAYLAEGEYEMGFIAYKQGDMAKAKELLTGLAARYEGEGGKAYPPLYKILAQKILAKIE